MKRPVVLAPVIPCVDSPQEAVDRHPTRQLILTNDETSQLRTILLEYAQSMRALVNELETGTAPVAFDELNKPCQWATFTRHAADVPRQWATIARKLRARLDP